MQQPKSEIADLFAQRQAIKNRLSQTCALDEVSIERLKRRFRKMLKSPTLSQAQQAAVYHELACLVGTQGRYTEAVSYMESSRGLGMDKFAVSFTTAYLALLNGRIIDARLLVENISSSVLPQTIPLLRAHQAQVGMLGDFMAEETLDSDFQREALEAKKVIGRLGISDFEITRRLDAACTLIRSHINHPIISYKLFASETEGILYRFLVNADTNKLADLNEMVLDMLIERFDEEIDNELSILVTPWSPSDSQISEEGYLVGVV